MASNTHGAGFALVRPEPVGQNGRRLALPSADGNSSPQPQLEESRTAPLHLSDRPVDLRFGFEQRQSGVGVGASMAAHICVAALIILLVIRFAPQPERARAHPRRAIKDIVWMAVPGPGGGGGGGGNKSPEPPRKAELPGKEKITVPVEKKPNADSRAAEGRAAA